MKNINKNKGWILPIMLVCGILLAWHLIPTTTEPMIKQTREWHTIWEGELGDLDTVYTGENTSILGVWVVNHSDNVYAYGNHSGLSADTGSHHAWQNDSTQFNNSVNVYGYAQSSSFDIEIPHSQAYDIIVRVRANSTHAATGSTATDQFNATWVSLNVTGYGIYGDVSTAANWTRFVTHNVSGDPFIYINFVYNGTEGLQGETDDNNFGTGSGDTIIRDNRTYLTNIALSCYY